MARLLACQAAIRRYAALKAITGGIMAVADVVFLSALGVNFALLFGLLVFALSFIPTVGYIIAVVPIVLLAFVQFGIVKALVVLAGLWLINTLVDNLVSPRLNATGLNLSLATTTVTVIFWAWALGPVGGLIAVPATLLVKDVFLVHYPETRWLADAMSSRVDRDTSGSGARQGPEVSPERSSTSTP